MGYAVEQSGRQSDRRIQETYKVGEVNVPAVKGAFYIPRQRFSVIIGPSGSGKTTLLKLIGCLDTPTAGRAIVAGQDVATLADNAILDFRAQKVGFIFLGGVDSREYVPRECRSWIPFHWRKY